MPGSASIPPRAEGIQLYTQWRNDVTNLSSTVVSFNPRKLDYAVYAGDTHSYEVWLVRGGVERVVMVYGFFYSDLAHSSAQTYRRLRGVALSMGWRP